jgi:hypothetical protein
MAVIVLISAGFAALLLAFERDREESALAGGN